MPRGDGSGPMGLGPVTGRAAGYPMPGFANPALYGCQGGLGGRGLRRRFWAAGFPGITAAVPYAPDSSPNPAMEAKLLANQIEMMEQSLKGAKERLQELRKNEE